MKIFVVILSVVVVLVVLAVAFAAYRYFATIRAGADTHHRSLGHGVLESAYGACFCRELRFCGLAFNRAMLEVRAP